MAKNYTMKNGHFTMTTAGRDAVTNGDWCFDLVDTWAQAIALRAHQMSGYTYGVHTVYGKHRVHGRVYCTTTACNNDTLDNNTLLKACY